MDKSLELTQAETDLLIQGKEAQAWAKRFYCDKSLEVMPHVYTDPRYSHWLPKITAELHDLYLQHAGNGYGQINSDFDLLLNLAGHPMNPLGTPAVIHRDHPVSAELQRVHKMICKRMTAGFTEGLTLSVAKMSQSAVPFFSHDLRYKSEIIHKWVHHFDQVLDAWRKGGSHALMDEGIFLAYAVGRRYQYDSMKEVVYNSKGEIIKVVFKARKAHTELGDDTSASKQLPPEFSPFVGRTRAREVWGMSGTFNYAWQMIVQGFRDYYSRKYEKIVHHISVMDTIASLPDGGVVMSFDFTEFDHSISRELQENWINAVEEAGVHPALCEMRRYVIGAPVIFHGGRILDKRLFMLGSFEMKTTTLDFGVQSGIADVADIDKSVGISVPLDIATRCGILKGELDYDLVLSDQHPMFRLRNMGDDTFMWFASQELADSFTKEAEKYTDFKVKPDDVPVFLGHTIVEQNGSRMALPNVARGVANILVPERAISHRLKQGVPRAFWAYGIEERNTYYRAHPLWDKVWDTVVRSLSDYAGYDVGAEIARQAAIQKTEANRMYPHLSVYDQMFLQNPSYINYRLSPQEVTQEVRDQYFLTVPSEEVFLFTKQAKGA